MNTVSRPMVIGFLTVAAVILAALGYTEAGEYVTSAPVVDAIVAAASGATGIAAAVGAFLKFFKKTPAE